MAKTKAVTSLNFSAIKKYMSQHQLLSDRTAVHYHAPKERVMPVLNENLV